MNFKIIIAQADPFEADSTARSFSTLGCEILGIGSTGASAIELAQVLKPDVLVMEPFLPALNCDDITEILEQQCDFPLVKLVISTHKNDLLSERFFNCGGDLFLMAPLDYQYCIQRIIKYFDVRKHHPSKDACEKDNVSAVRRCTQKLQSRMGMPMTVNGFVYLQDAVELALFNRRMLQAVTTQLYPTIGQRHQISPHCVERCIRTAIELTCERGDMDFICTHFGCSVRGSTGKPTNSEFIAIFAELVRNELNSFS